MRGGDGRRREGVAGAVDRGRRAGDRRLQHRFENGLSSEFFKARERGRNFEKKMIARTISCISGDRTNKSVKYGEKEL
jgi:hypothetical protein